MTSPSNAWWELDVHVFPYSIQLRSVGGVVFVVYLGWGIGGLGCWAIEL